VFRGNALARVDDKSRLKIPSVFRRLLDEHHGRRLYVTSLTGDNVWVYPFDVWTAKEEILARHSSIHQSVNKFLTRTSYFGQVTEMDAQGRVVINPVLRESARIAGEVAVLGYLNYLEVWNNELFRERVLDQPLTAEDRRVLAELGL
jgi:MraZ protein